MGSRNDDQELRTLEYDDKTVEIFIVNPDDLATAVAPFTMTTPNMLSDSVLELKH